MSTTQTVASPVVVKKRLAPGALILKTMRDWKIISRRLQLLSTSKAKELVERWASATSIQGQPEAKARAMQGTFYLACDFLFREIVAEAEAALNQAEKDRLFFSGAEELVERMRNAPHASQKVLAADRLMHNLKVARQVRFDLINAAHAILFISAGGKRQEIEDRIAKIRADLEAGGDPFQLRERLKEEVWKPIDAFVAERERAHELQADRIRIAETRGRRMIPPRCGHTNKTGNPKRQAARRARQLERAVYSRSMKGGATKR